MFALVLAPGVSGERPFASADDEVKARQSSMQGVATVGVGTHLDYPRRVVISDTGTLLGALTSAPDVHSIGTRRTAPQACELSLVCRGHTNYWARRYSKRGKECKLRQRGIHDVSITPDVKSDAGVRLITEFSSDESKDGNSFRSLSLRLSQGVTNHESKDRNSFRPLGLRLIQPSKERP